MTSVGADAPASDASDRLAALARRVIRLAPSRHNPEQFHMDKSEIAAELRRIASEVAA